MKSSFVTALSLVGVIGSGSAAALVNTSIFDSAPDAVEAAFVPGAAVVELTLPKVDDPAGGSANASGMSLEQLTEGAEEQTSATNSSASVDQAASSQAAESSQSASSGSTSAASSSGSLSVKEAVTTTVASPPEQPSLLTRYDLGGSGSVTVDVLDGQVTLIDATAAAGWTVIKSEFDAVANQVEIELSDGSMVVDFEVRYVAGVLVPDIRTESVSNGHHDDHEDDDDDHEEHDDDDHEEHDDD
jgi:hypothetical protein